MVYVRRRIDNIMAISQLLLDNRFCLGDAEFSPCRLWEEMCFTIEEAASGLVCAPDA